MITVYHLNIYCGCTGRCDSIAGCALPRSKDQDQIFRTMKTVLFLWHKLKTIHLCHPLTTRIYQWCSSQQPAIWFIITVTPSPSPLQSWTPGPGIMETLFRPVIFIPSQYLKIPFQYHTITWSARPWPGIGSCQFLLYKADFMSGFRFCQISESVNNAAMTWCLDKCLKISSTIISPSISAFQCVDDTWCLNTKCHAREPVTFQQFLTKATSAIKSISRKYFNYLVKYLHKMQWNASAQVYLKFLMVMGKRSTAWLWTGVMLNLTGKQSWWNLTTELRPTDGTQIRCLLLQPEIGFYCK